MDVALAYLRRFLKVHGPNFINLRGHSAIIDRRSLGFRVDKPCFINSERERFKVERVEKQGHILQLPHCKKWGKGARDFRIKIKLYTYE